jgi:hypothetical protein
MRKCGGHITESTAYPHKPLTEPLAELLISEPPEKEPLPVTLPRRTPLK